MSIRLDTEKAKGETFSLFNSPGPVRIDIDMSLSLSSLPPTAIDLPQSGTEDTNPLARIAGSYANDPNWEEFMQAMEASRRELDEASEVA